MRYLIVLLAGAGIVVSSLALRVHFMDPAAAPPCAVSEHWDCGTVNHSKYAVFPPLGFDEAPGKVHVPVAVFGIAGYVLIAGFAAAGRLRVVLELARVGFFFAAFLTYIEAYILETWCIYCVWSQAIITAILIAAVVAILLRRRRRAESVRAVLSEHVD
ncbi:MAG: vitamin K epoxide reductase family protein [Acidobacteriota bacterium]|nr:vitamin K epoxide reductase family protein [Acidobacteriota bacterium]